MTETSHGQSSPLKKLEEVVRRAFFKIHPAFGKFDRPIFAKVIKVNSTAGKVDETKKQYSVDVQPLLKNLTPDPSFEKIIDVPLNVGTFGNGGVVYCSPKVGAIVRLGFMYSDPTFPFIINITNEGISVPKGSLEEFRIETADGAILQFKGNKVNFKIGEFNSNLEKLVGLVASMNSVFTNATPAPPDGGAALQLAWIAATATWESELKSGTL